MSKRVTAAEVRQRDAAKDAKPEKKKSYGKVPSYLKKMNDEKKRKAEDDKRDEVVADVVGRAREGGMNQPNPSMRPDQKIVEVERGLRAWLTA